MVSISYDYMVHGSYIPVVFCFLDDYLLPDIPPVTSVNALSRNAAPATTTRQSHTIATTPQSLSVSDDDFLPDITVLRSYRNTANATTTRQSHTIATTPQSLSVSDDDSLPDVTVLRSSCNTANATTTRQSHTIATTPQLLSVSQDIDTLSDSQRSLQLEVTR